MHILVTRPREDAAALTQALEAAGHRVLAEPLLSIAFLPAAEAPLDLAGLQALVFTSANGVRAFAARSDLRALPVLAVGDATARLAHDLGFARVASAGGDVASLAALVTEELDPRRGALLHPAASAVAGDLQGRLTAAGFDLRRAVLYRAETADALSPACRTALEAGDLDLVLLYSPRTAACFARLIEASGLSYALKGCRAACLSPAVAEEVAGLPWAESAAAVRPDQESLLALVARMENTRG